MTRAAPIQANLERLVATYRKELDARIFESSEVREAKKALLDQLVKFDETPGAPDYLTQIDAKLGILSRIKFGASTGKEIVQSLTDSRPDLVHQYKGSTFVKNFIDKLLQFFASKPYQHFDDVIHSVKTVLQESSSNLSYRSSEEAAAGTKLNSALMGRRTISTKEEERKEQENAAMRDFARTVSLGGTVYRHAGSADEAYTGEMEARIRAFTGETDITKGLAGEIAHMPAQAYAGFITEELLDKIPAFDPRVGDAATPILLPEKMAWVREGDNYFLDQEFKVYAAVSDEKAYVVDPNPDATKPGVISDMKEAMDISRGRVPSSEALVTCKVRIRFSLAKGADRPTPTVENFTIYNRYPGFFKFSPTAEAHLKGSLGASVAAPPASLSGNPAWTAARVAGTPVTATAALKAAAHHRKAVREGSEDEGEGTRGPSNSLPH